MPDEKPLLFISHKHENRAIADAIRNFVEMNTAGAVEVFQSSSEQAAGPRAGFSLNQELKEALWRASAFILVYTHRDRDWGFCMFEFGVANSSNSPETRMILLRCCEDVPKQFEGQVSVSARSREDIEKFVDEFLTSPTFFRDRDRAITQHQSKSRAVTAAADSLWQSLQSCLPSTNVVRAEEWPAYPFIQLQLDAAHVNELRNVPVENRCELVQRKAAVSDYDKFAAMLFNCPAFEKGMTLDQLVQSWREKNDRRDEHSRWAESLCRQIADGARWQFPTLSWELMQGMDDGRWYAPIVTRVRRIPDQYYQFDVYFFRFELDAEQKRPVIGVPG